jgi:hypothetical protein
VEAQCQGIRWVSCLHTGVCYESHDDELMDAVFLELQIEICIGETTGTPMLLGHDFARLRLELAADLAAPRAVFEGLSRPRCLLNWRNVLPTFPHMIDQLRSRFDQSIPTPNHR